MYLIYIYIYVYIYIYTKTFTHTHFIRFQHGYAFLFLLRAAFVYDWVADISAFTFSGACDQCEWRLLTSAVGKGPSKNGQGALSGKVCWPLRRDSGALATCARVWPMGSIGLGPGQDRKQTLFFKAIYKVVQTELSLKQVNTKLANKATESSNPNNSYSPASYTVLPITISCPLVDLSGFSLVHTNVS